MTETPRIARASVAFAALSLTGCVSLARFDGTATPVAHDPTTLGVPKVDDVIRYVQCSIIGVARSGKPAYEHLKDMYYVAYVQLTLDVTDDGGVNPTLSFIHPFAAASTNRTLGFGANLDGTAHRTFSQNFTLDLGSFKPDPSQIDLPKSCSPMPGGVGLRGNLGIEQIMAEGLQHADNNNFLIPLVKNGGDEGEAINAAAPTYVPTFGSTIDFTIVYGTSADPVWTLTHFTGPGGSKLLQYTRTNKETLTITFAGVPRPKERSIAEVRAFESRAPGVAARAAQDAAIQILLQRLLPGGH